MWIFLLQLQGLVVVLYTNVVVVDGEMFQHIKCLWMNHLQFLVDIQCLLEVVSFFIKLSLDIEQGFIIRTKGKTLAYELLQVGIVLVVNAQVHCRRYDVIVGRIVI